ncbi:MAG: helix-turn-helix transcriptional regulator [Kiritimatiellae bacterium]|nr:helix-turn-helix transcriptional regulator [Kiritimatiellia bacterium]
MDDRERLMRILDGVLRRVRFREVILASDRPAAPSGAFTPGRARIFVLLRGCRHFEIGRGDRAEELRLVRGQLLFAGATAWHRSIDRVRNSLLSVIFDPEYTAITWKAFVPGPLAERRHPSVLVHVPTPRRRGLELAVQTLSELAVESDAGPAALPIARGLLKLVRREMASAPRVVSRPMATWQAVCNHLREHFHEPVNRDLAAQTFGLHPNHLSRLFRTQAGEGFTTYLTRLRLEHAAELLKAGGLPVCDVALRCGFAGGNYFAKVFRGHFGMSPSAYRRRAAGAGGGARGRGRG